MTRGEAAEILGLRVRVVARQHGWAITKDLVESVMSEARHWPGLFPAAVASGVSWRTVLRYASSEG